MNATEICDPPNVAGLEAVVDGLVHDVRGALGTMRAAASLARTRSESGDIVGAMELLARLDGAVTRTNDLCNDARRRPLQAPEETSSQRRPPSSPARMPVKTAVAYSA